MVQTGKVTNYPIVLMGSEYWSGLVDWIRQTLVIDGYINPEDPDLFLITDDPEEAVAHIVKCHEVIADQRIRNAR